MIKKNFYLDTIVIIMFVNHVSYRSLTFENGFNLEDQSCKEIFCFCYRSPSVYSFTINTCSFFSFFLQNVSHC